ncbi:MAG: glycosyltransferase family 4 protein [Chloroflexi bacterium]|nr:glycosyltransferase family 4 protein [Chloroflexota bacterium]
MRVGLNAHLLSSGATYRGAGISRYIRNLLLHLPQVAGGEGFTVFVGDRQFSEELGALVQLRRSWLPTARPWMRILWEQCVQPAVVRLDRVDVLHSLAFVQPMLCPVPSVVTVHDLSFLLYPEAHPMLHRSYLRLFTRLTVHRAARIIAVSQSTKEDVVRLLGADASRVDVVYHGIEESFRPIADVEQGRRFRERMGLPERYILYVGTLEPRKNLVRLVRAFAQLRREHGLPHWLVLAGPPGWGERVVYTTIEAEGVGDRVLFPGYLPAQELPLWYNTADLFVYPSLYEGFGFPPLEAMACGVPVVVSNRASLPEVVGEAGVLVDPEDTEGLAEAMARVLTDKSLRSELAARGRTQASRFSWRQAALQTTAVYRSSLAAVR